jgi:hypothetical protein
MSWPARCRAHRPSVALGNSPPGYAKGLFFLSDGKALTDRGEYRQAAGVITQDLIRGPSYNGSLVVSATENTHAATAPTGDFCFGYDRTRSLRLHLHAETVKKLPMKSLKAAVSDEHQPGCFALEEEKGDHWTGSGVPNIKEARPTL